MTGVERSNGPLVLVMMPVFDDWQSVRLLLPALDRALHQRGWNALVLLLDDGSTTPPPPDLISPEVKGAIRAVDCLRLRRNLGHQRAICVGLTQFDGHPRYASIDVCCVMDADGEDDPADLARLLDAFVEKNGSAAVFASRLKRSEGLGFRISYATYRIIHRILTGLPVRIGNFSALSRAHVRQLVVTADLWSHYAAAAVQVRLPMHTIPAARARRLQGRSRMNLTSLVSHGLGAMAVFGDRIGVRLLGVAAIGGALIFLALTALALAWAFGDFVLPVWVSRAAGFVALLIGQTFLLALVFAFLIFMDRSRPGFVPNRDGQWFVDRLDTLWSVND